MDSIKKTELYKSRGYTACISAALSTTTHNLKTIFTHTWAYAAAVAVTLSSTVSAVTTVLTADPYQRMSESTATQSAATMVWLALSLLLSVCALTAFTGRCATLVNGGKTLWSIKRASRPTLVTIVFWIIVAVALSAVALTVVSPQKADSDPKALLTVGLALDAAYLVIGLLTLPYIYVFTKYMVEPDTKLRRLLTKGYKTGLRHWGFTVTTLLLATLCTTVCAVIIAFPAVIIMSAKAASISGVNTYGDPSGLPSCFGAMQFGVFAVGTFVWTYVSVFSLFVCYYMYGSIETREKEKKDYLTRQQQTEK